MRGLSNKIAFIFGNLLMIGLFSYGVYNFITVKSFADVILLACIIIICGILSGILFYILYVRHWVDNFGDFIYFPHTKYKHLKPNLSRIQGDINGEKYIQARVDLEKICEEYSDFFQAVFMLFNLYSEKFGEAEEACRLAENYFACSKRVRNDEQVIFLFRYADLLIQEGQKKKLLELLKREQKLSIYSKHDKLMIGRRIDNLINL